MSDADGYVRLCWKIRENPVWTQLLVYAPRLGSFNQELSTEERQ